MAKPQEIILRVYDMGSAQDISPRDILDAINEVIEAANVEVGVYMDEVLERQCLMLASKNKDGFMKVFSYIQIDGGNIIATSSVLGKGNWVKATDLEKWFYKGLGSFDKFQYRMEQGNYMRNKLKGTGVAGGVGAAAGLAIRGTFKLAAKGFRALMRDQEAYEEEMDFYKLAVGIIDFTVGGNDSYGLIEKIKENAESGSAVAQYVLAESYLRGVGVPQNEASGFGWHEEAAKNGNLKSQNIVAGEYLYGENECSKEKKEIGVRYLYNILESGEEWPISHIVDIYAKGAVDGIEIDYEKVLRFAYEYGQQGYVYPMYIAAKIYDGTLENATDEIVQYVDYERAADLYKAFIDTNVEECKEEAAMKLANMHKEGIGVLKSDDESIRYYYIAARCGNNDAKATIINRYAVDGDANVELDDAKNFCDDLMKTGEKKYLPIIFYGKHKIADRNEEYKESLRLAKLYLSCEGSDPVLGEEVEQYVRDLENKIASMTDEERRLFLKEPKPINKKIVLVACVLVLACALAYFAPKYFKGKNPLPHIGQQSGNTITQEDSEKKNEANSSETHDNEFVLDDGDSGVITESAEEALNAYNVLLTGGPFPRDLTDDSIEIWNPENCHFCVAYVDEDDIPELFIDNWGDASHATGWGQLYTYENEGIRSITMLSSPTGEDIGKTLGYYERSGWFETFGMWQGYGALSIIQLNSDAGKSFSINYEPGEDFDAVIVGYSISDNPSVNYTEEEFYKELEAEVGKYKYIPFVFHENTSENRKKYLLPNQEVKSTSEDIGFVVEDACDEIVPVVTEFQDKYESSVKLPRLYYNGIEMVELNEYLWDEYYYRPFTWEERHIVEIIWYSFGAWEELRSLVIYNEYFTPNSGFGGMEHKIYNFDNDRGVELSPEDVYLMLGVEKDAAVEGILNSISQELNINPSDVQVDSIIPFINEKQELCVAFVYYAYMYSDVVEWEKDVVIGNVKDFVMGL